MNNTTITEETAESLESQGNDLFAQGKFQEALDYFVKSQKMNTNRASIYLKLGKTYLAVNDHHQAKTALSILINSNNANAEAIALYAESILKFGEIDKALEIIENLLKNNLEDEQHYIALQVYHKILVDKGDREKIIEVSEHVMELRPEEYYYFRSWVKYKKLSDEDHDLINKYASIANKITGIKNDKEDIFYALAEAYHKSGDYKKAVKYIQRANAIYGAKNKFDMATVRKATDAAKTLISRDLISDRENFGDTESKPIFIIGMPRSATSLTEQILSSHSKVKGCGELLAIMEISKTLVGKHDIKKLQSEHFEQYAKLYLEAANKASKVDEELITTDKMPTNYFYLGFVYMLFPNARIIHCQRDLRDVAISNYFQKFATGNQYANSMKDIVTNAEIYRELMEYWQETLPYEIYDFNYEKLLENPEAETRKLLEYCDLEWEDACLNFHKNKRVIHTASKAQVTQKLFKTSMEKWRNYEPFFQEEMKKLGELNWS